MTYKYIQEANRNTKTARTTRNPSNKTITRRSWNSPNISIDRSIARSCCSLAVCVQKRRRKSIDKQTTPSRPWKLSDKQLLKLQKLLLKGPKANGYRTKLWTLRRITQLIKKYFGQLYQLSGVWYVLSRMGWICQKPEKRARERAEQAIAC